MHVVYVRVYLLEEAAKPCERSPIQIDEALLSLLLFSAVLSSASNISGLRLLANKRSLGENPIKLFVRGKV